MVTALLVLATLLGPALGAAARPVAAQDAPPTAERAPLQPRLVELTSTSTFVAPDGVVELAFRLDDAPAGATVDLALHPRVQNRIRFGETVAGLRLGNPVRAFRDLPAADLPRDAGGVVRLSFQLVTEGEPPLAGFVLADQGVYPLSLTVLDPEGQELDRLITHVVRLPEPGEQPDANPLAVAVVVPLGGPPAFRPDGTAALDPADASSLEAVAAAVAAEPELPVTLGPTPETVDALEPAGHADLEATLAEAASGREVLASTYVPLHLASWHALDGTATIGDQLAAGAEALDDRLGTEAVAGSWVLDPTVDPAALAGLVDLGVEQVVVPEEQLEGLDPGDFPVTMTQSFALRDATGRLVPAVQADSALEAHLRSSDQPALAANRALADLGVLALDLPLVPRGAVLRTGVADAEVLAPFLAGLRSAGAPAPSAAPLLEAMTVDALVDHVAVAEAPDGSGDEGQVLVRGWRWEAPLPLDDLAEGRADVERTIGAYRSMVGEDDEAVRQSRRLVRMAGDVRPARPDAAAPSPPVDPERAQAFLDGATALVGARLGAVRAPEQVSVTLTASDASVPVVIDNGLDVEVRVLLHLRSDKLVFPDGSPVEVTLAPGQNRVEVRVRARASGVFPVQTTITTPDGDLELDEARVRVRSAAVSGLGVLLSVGAGLFLCVWWARNWRKTRRARRLVSSSHPSLGAPDVASGTPADRRPSGS